MLRPGAWVTRAELHPSAEYPEIPVLLEYSVAPARDVGLARRSPSLYVLWRWQPDLRQWRELGRVASDSWDWAIDLRPLAIRALAQGRGETADAAAVDLSRIARDISVFLDKQLEILPPADRARLIGILHDQFATRFIA